MRTLLLSLHILAVCLWFGGSVMNGVINAKLAATDSIEAKANLARVEVNLGTQFYMPAAIVTLLTGVALVLTNEAFGFEMVWISFGFLAIIVAAALGPLKFKPLSEQIATGYETGNLGAAEAAVKQITVWSSINSGLLLIAIILMVAKP